MKSYFPRIVEPLSAYPRIGGAYTISEDSTGLIRVAYRSVGDQRTPTAVAQYALANYNSYVETKDDTNASRFIAHADWLVANGVPCASGGIVWPFNFAWRTVGYRCPPGWCSAMTQGQVLSVLLRAASLTGGKRYKEYAELAFLPFTRTVAEGGVVEYRQGDILLQEYAVPGAPTPLNGYIFALLGLYEYSEYISEPRARDITNQAAQTLARRLHRYRAPLVPWSRYDDKYNWLASPYYHRVHVNQLISLCETIGNPEFQDYATAWGHVLSSPPRTYQLTRQIFWLTWKSGRALQTTVDKMRGQ